MNNDEYYIGEIFVKNYPTDVADWCDKHNAWVVEIEPQDGVKRFQIQVQEPYIPTQEEINNLTMTALDFINFIRSCGLSLADIKEYLSLHEELDTQLTYCQNVYCGVVKAIAPIEYKGVTITDAMIEHAFKVKNGMV